MEGRVSVDFPGQFRFVRFCLLFTIVLMYMQIIIKGMILVLRGSHEHARVSTQFLYQNTGDDQKSSASCQTDLCFTARVATENTLMVLKFVQHVLHK